jgi:hypothetical protein
MKIQFHQQSTEKVKYYYFNLFQFLELFFPKKFTLYYIFTDFYFILIIFILLHFI